jgi:hypothetical protein
MEHNLGKIRALNSSEGNLQPITPSKFGALKSHICVHL